MSESKEIRIMRNMAWERAKGELESVKTTYWSNDNFEHFYKAVNDFIELVESNGWQE